MALPGTGTSSPGGGGIGGLLGQIAAPLVSGGMSLLGGLFQQQNQDAQQQQLEGYQTQMSDTAYQRSVADMTKAGLNPALMYGSGGPESSPAGAMAPQQNILGPAGQAGVSSAIDAAQAQKSMQSQDASIASTMAQAALTTAKIPVENLEGGVASTVQSALTGIENILQGWGKTNASASGISGIVSRGLSGAKDFGQYVSTGGDSNPSADGTPPQPYGWESSADQWIDNLETGR